MAPPPPPGDDTIAAISTPPGRGGIGIVRLSGPAALAVAHGMLRLSQSLEHARARFARLVDPSGAAVDDCVVTAFLAPHSYTGEDLVEIAAHGSPVVLEWAISRALTLGARLAQPGEFSRRAFLSGRLDLTQAEAIHDLIAAQTLEQARVAAQQMGGALSRRVAPIKQSLLHLIAELEAGMDFASGELDDVDTMPPKRIAAALAAVEAPTAALLRSFTAGSLQRNGLRLALVGRPNAGKSSLFNRLLERERAIVTPVPGTTRDTLEETLAVDGIPIRLVDTAGLRDTHADQAEALGIARSREALADADFVLLVIDAALPLSPDDLALVHSLETRPHLVVWNKIDLLPQPSAPRQPDTPAPATTPTPPPPETPPTTEDTPSHPAPSHPATHPALNPPPELPTAIATSAHTGQGLAQLRAALLAQIRSGAAGADEAALNNLRQREAVATTLDALHAAADANTAGLPHEVLLLDLHRALQSLDALTGTTSTDDILTLIFGRFCIGK